MNGQRIQNITAEGLTYLKDDGTEGFIDFAACYERDFAKFMQPDNLKRHQEANHLDDEQLKQSIEKAREWKEVAYTMPGNLPMGNAPYIEFYTEPPTRFEFVTDEAFWEVRRAIRRNGWRTIDLS